METTKVKKVKKTYCPPQIERIEIDNEFSLFSPVVINSSSYVFNNFNTSACPLYVPLGSKSAYQAAVQLKDFTNIVEMTTAVPKVYDTNLSLYLNPMDDAICINRLKGMLRVFDINDRLLLARQVAGNESISIGSLPQGLYIVKLITAEGMVERKVTKK